MTLEEIRKKIDAIDAQLLPLFEARMDCAREVAAVKKEAGLPVLNPEREKAILDRVAEQAGDYAGAARVLYSTLMEVSRGLQHGLLDSGAPLRALVAEAKPLPEQVGRIATFGRPGSFSHAAAQRLFPRGPARRPCASIPIRRRWRSARSGSPPCICSPSRVKQPQSLRSPPHRKRMPPPSAPRKPPCPPD